MEGEDHKNSMTLSARKQYVQLLVSEFFSCEALTDDDRGIPKASRQRLLTNVVEEGLKCLEERVGSYCSELKAVDSFDAESVQTLVNSFSIMENYLMQIYRNRIAEVVKKDFTEDELEDWNDKLIHQDVITKILPDFLKDVNFDGSNIMDSLISKQLMTDDDRDSIIDKSTPRKRKEAFLNLMRGKLTYKALVDTFIPVMETDHPHVAEKIKAVVLDIQENPPLTSVCVVCSMKQRVQVKQLAERLILYGAISPDVYEELRSDRTGNPSKWSTLLETVPNPNFITEAINHVFPDIYNSLKTENAISLQCRCQDLNDMRLYMETFTIVTDNSIDVANLDDVQSILNSIDSGEAKTLRYKTFTMPKLRRKLKRNHIYVKDSMLQLVPRVSPLPDV